MAAAVEPARLRSMIAMSVCFTDNPGLEAPVLRPERQTKAWPGKTEAENVVSGYIYPDKIIRSIDADQSGMLSIPRLANSFPPSADPCEALNPQTP
jgi:hypothetical protein